jgi:hypothetical protein
MNIYELDVKVRSRIYRVWVAWPKSFWKGAETESFHDYVDVMISGPFGCRRYDHLFLLPVPPCS